MVKLPIILFSGNAGETGQEVFIITENDDVFACGPNHSGCLVFPEEEVGSLTPVKVPELCGKNIKGKLATWHFESPYFMTPL